MRFSELASGRLKLGSGIYLMITRRCPMACAHCSTGSTPHSEQAPSDLYRRFVETFSLEDRPDFLMVTGGEALVRPQLVRDLGNHARRVGSRTCLSTGLFFARSERFPTSIEPALFAVDHVAVSLDRFHEQEVPRERAFRAVERILAMGKAASFHLVGDGPDDPYTLDAITEIRERFNDAVPIIVSNLNPTGRAANWLETADRSQSTVHQAAEKEPCGAATWPVVGFDGTVVACCNQSVIDGPSPSHLTLGNIVHDDWPTIRRRLEAHSVIRALTLFGPRYVAHQLGAKTLCGPDYCGVCKSLADIPEIEMKVDAWLKEPQPAALAAVIGQILEAKPLVTMPEFEHLMYLDAQGDTAGAQPAHGPV